MPDWRSIDVRLTSIGLGPYPEVTHAEGRQKALNNGRRVRLGQDAAPKFYRHGATMSLGQQGAN